MLTIRLASWYRKVPQTEEAMIKAWKSGKDFLILSINSPYCGHYCSIRDIPDEKVKIRYNHDTDFVIC